MKTYRAMLAEIERLQRKAEARRRVEIKGVVKHIRELIAQHGLSSHDLGLDTAKASAAPRQFRDLLAAAPVRGRKAGKVSKAAASKGVARYRDPATGKTWTGRGKPPNWIAGAKDRTAFEIGVGAADAAPTKAAKAAKTAKPRKAAKAVKAKRAPQAAAKQARGAKAAKPAAKKPVAKKASAKKASAKKAVAKPAAPAKAAKPAKAPKAVKLPKPPVPKAAKAAAKKAKPPKVVAPAPAPADSGNGAAPAPSAE